jgi:glycosyltransferase involved in cell wall biosynthesis
MKTKKNVAAPPPALQGERPPSAQDSPMVAIVIPLFKHSVLVVDALQSVLSQQTRYPFVVIVVNDGCPFQESDLQIKAILAVHPNLRYLVQPNRGLSAARNTGIDYALRHFPNLESVYLMDADNVILPGTMDAAFSKLLAEPGTSWIYPNIDMFGIRRNFDYSGPYSLLRHTQYNICEAGSLVHRRIFDAGIRFDEKMKLGYEDWDFWLTAAGRGFRGAHHPYFGFQYRNRGESMLSQAQRDDAEILSYLRRKHAPLLGKRSLLRLESVEALRYAIFFTDSNEVLFTNGSSDPRTAMRRAAFDELFWRNILVPSRQYIPPFFVFMTRALFDELSNSGLLLWVLHDRELMLQQMNISCLVIHFAPGTAYEIAEGGRASDSEVVALGRDLVCSSIHSPDTTWIEGLVSPPEEMKVSIKTLTMPRGAGLASFAKGGATFALLLAVRSWRGSPYRAASTRSWIWRELSVPPPHNLYYNVRAEFGDTVPYPYPSEPSRNIGFIMPIATFGGVERVAYNLAQQFARAGWRAHLFVVGATRIQIPEEFTELLASINFLHDASFEGWDQQREYQGTALSSVSNNHKAKNTIVAALAWLDAVVNCHSGEFNAAAADLRQLGVKTAAHVHLLDLSPHGRSVGHPMIALAYEHAYDLVLCPSAQLLSWMHGAGVPSEKLLHVRNAPGYSLDPETRKKILARRASSSRRGRLNVLYMGRLDRQKGMDRLAEVIRQSRNSELPLDWRIVGSSVTGPSPIPSDLQAMREAPVFEGEAISSLLGWADVMVLLSDYEGVPLSILEAQRLGVIVIATDVGALSEIISTGKNGFLVDRETAVHQTLSLLTLLTQSPELRSRISAAAACHVVEWRESAEELIERLSAAVKGDFTRLERSGIRAEAQSLE